MTEFSSTWFPGVLVVGVACLCGCSAEKSPEVVSRVELLAFSGDSACEGLEAYIEDTAVREMRTELEAARDGVPSWGWWTAQHGRGVGETTAGASPSSSAGPKDYTTTNNQVAGVDEADFVKNDGTRIFVLSGQALYAVKSWPAESTALAGKLAIEGYPRELFLDGADRAVVFSSLYRWYPLSSAPVQGPECVTLDCGYWYSNTVKVTVVDVSDLANLKVRYEYFLPGQYSSGRKIGSSVRVLLSNGFDFPPGVKWYPEYESGLYEDAARLRAAFDKIIADNERLIRAQTLVEWVPASRLRQNQETTTIPQPCTSFYRANAPTRLGTISVATINLASQSLDRSTILAEPGEVYASEKSLYLATRHWWWWPAPGQHDVTYIHKFDLTNPDVAPYLASGVVDGHIVDQFSMDEATSGHFRIVTTVANRVADATAWWGRLELTNRLTVLQEQSGALDRVGSSGDFAPGETAMASRIIGDKGFVVTYRQVDPLFTFDLKDPNTPTLVAALTVPGLSTYMHPLDDAHLLSIGVSGSGTVQLAMFDVSDLAHPRQTFVEAVGDSSGWSEAGYEHKAFNFFPAKKLLAIPFASWKAGTTSGDAFWSGFTSDLRVYSVETGTGFTARGALTVSDLYEVQHFADWTYYWAPSVRRSVMADDFVYAISDSGIRVANVANLSLPLATVRFDRYAP